MNSFVVTTSVRGSTKSQVWNSDQPLPLGHPFRFVLERSKSGVRLRDLSNPLNQIEAGRAHEIPNEKLRHGAEIEVHGYKFKIQPTRLIVPAYEGAPQGSTLRIYRCAGKWILDSETLENTVTARYQGKAVFQLKPQGQSFALQCKAAGLKLNRRGETRALSAGESVELSSQDLLGTTLSFVGSDSASIQSWKFGLASAPAFIDQAQAHRATASAFEVAEQEDYRAFLNAARYVAIGVVAFGLLTLLWPKPKEDPKELIPAQIAKIVMQQPKKKASASASPEAGSASKMPQKVKDAAVVQAFRAKALSSAVNGLLKGGMTKLLAQSDFVAGTAKSMEARKIFDSKSDALKTGATVTGLDGARNVQVAAVGGGNGAGGAAVGYGKGEHAGVKGQGKGFVPFVSADANGSVVDEGLTKDEVGEVIHRHLSEVRYCYESAMVRTPDIEGKLITNFTIGPNGVVKTADVKSSTLPDPRLDDCILRRLVTWQFPKPRGGVEVSVSYPFIFKTLGR